MRSGQYKLAGAGSRATSSDVTLGHFRSSQLDLAPSQSSFGEFPHMNSLVVTKHKLLDTRPINKSCENLSSSGARSAVTRVEQRVKSFLQRGESRLRQGEAAAPEGVWQYGHVVTLPRRPKLSLALSHSALHHLSSADTASCLSASSGYSSSSSSSYGSFKSSTSSSCSTLPRKKSHSESGTGVGEGHSHLSLARSCTLVDNPMYDVTPATDPRSYSCGKSPKRIHSPSSRLESNYVSPDTDSYSLRDSSCQRQVCLSPHDSIYEVMPNGDPNSPYGESQTQGHENLYDLAGPSRLTPDSGTHGGLDSLEESALDSLDCSDPHNGVLEDDIVKEEDQVAKKCREYFERRLKNSETLKKRWSMCSSDSGADSGDSDVSPSSLPASASPPNITSNTSLPSPVATQVGASSKKTPIDQKMEFLRKEIASLMSQDNALFRQLLTLHESISALKTAPARLPRPTSPASLDSFTEEEEDDEDDGEEDDDDEQVSMGEKTGREHENLSDVDEGLDTDHSTSPTSTLSSKSSRDSHFSRSSSKVECNRPHHNFVSLTHNFTKTGTKITNANNNIGIKNDSDIKHGSSSTIEENFFEKCNNSTVTKFASNKKSRRFSITTSEDFNINITINTDDASSFSNSTSQCSVCTSKSSCYFSTSNPDTRNRDTDKTFIDSLGNPCPEEWHFVRTRVSIPPSSRNRNRSARPESFRLSSDMATYNRVLLKARSFAGASLRESSTHRNNVQRNFTRTSLREDKLSYQREKECSPQNALNKMECVQGRRANPCKTLSKNCAFESFSDNYMVFNSRPYTVECIKADDEYYDPELATKEDNSVGGKFDEMHTFPKAINLVVLNTLTRNKHLKHNGDCWKPRNFEPLALGSLADSDSCVKKDDCCCNKANNTVNENTLLPTEPNLSTPDTTLYEKEPTGSTYLPNKTSHMIPASTFYKDSQELQKLPTRSFTGMVTLCPTVSSNQTLPREVLNNHISSMKSTSSFKITCGNELDKRAHVSHDGYVFCFSSDRGLRTSSKVKPKSKQEVFV